MTKLFVKALNLRADRKGVTALEYGLIAALIAVVIIGSVQLIGTNARDAFSAIASALTPAAAQ